MTEELPQSSPTPTAPPQAPVAPPAPARRRESNLAGIVIGLIILGVGLYYLFRETLQIALPDIGELWPIVVILIGAAILWVGFRRSNA